jgi:iron complex outermembrane receptor protein
LGSNPGDISGCTTRKIGSYDTWDLSGGYTEFLNTNLRLGIKNIFNRDPPLSNQVAAIQIGYDPNYADPRGRTFYAAFQYVFR